MMNAEEEARAMMDIIRSDLLTVERMQSKWLLRMGQIYSKDKTRGDTTQKAVAISMLIRLRAATVSATLPTDVHILVEEAARHSPKEMPALRRNAGHLFDKLGAINQRSTAACACYVVYLLAGCFDDPNGRVNVYAIADAFGWIEKTGVDMEGLWAQILLLLD